MSNRSFKTIVPFEGVTLPEEITRTVAVDSMPNATDILISFSDDRKKGITIRFSDMERDRAGRSRFGIYNRNFPTKEFFVLPMERFNAGKLENANNLLSEHIPGFLKLWREQNLVDLEKAILAVDLAPQPKPRANAKRTMAPALSL